MHIMRVPILFAALLYFCPGLFADNKPNILFIFADDQCYDTIRSLGNNEIETPHLDRLVKRGTTFTHAYNQGGWNGAICVASRHMLITGRYIWHAHKASQNMKQEVTAGRTWPQILKQTGYDTYMTGKWHVKAKPQDIFDNVSHVRGGMPNQTKAGYNRPIEGQEMKWRPWDKQFGGFWKGGKHWSEVLGDDAVGFLKQAKEKKNPFFMYLAFNAPHDPRQAPKSYVDKYPLDKISMPKNFLKEYPYGEEMGSGRRLRDERLAPYPRTNYAVKVNRQEYYAIITHMDTQIGRILDELEASGKADNTYIFFSADHGLSVGHHGLIGKQNMYDHSVRVPLIVCGPGVPKDNKINTPVYFQDVMPTSIDLAGLQKPDHINFKSLLPLIQGKSKKQYDAIYGAYVQHQRMISKDGYKLIYYPRANKLRLFDLNKDPMEMNDLADNKEYSVKIKSLLKDLKALQKEVGDTFPIGDATAKL